MIKTLNHLEQLRAEKQISADAFKAEGYDNANGGVYLVWPKRRPSTTAHISQAEGGTGKAPFVPNPKKYVTAIMQQAEGDLNASGRPAKTKPFTPNVGQISVFIPSTKKYTTATIQQAEGDMNAHGGKPKPKPKNIGIGAFIIQEKKGGITPNAEISQAEGGNHKYGRSHMGQRNIKPMGMRGIVSDERKGIIPNVPLPKDAYDNAEGLYMDLLIDKKPIGVTSYNASGSNPPEQADMHYGYKMGAEAFNEITRDIIRRNHGDVSQNDVIRNYDAFTDHNFHYHHDAGATAPAAAKVVNPAANAPKVAENDSFKEKGAEVGAFEAHAAAANLPADGMGSTGLSVALAIVAGGCLLFGLRRYTKMKMWEIAAVSVVGTGVTYLGAKQIKK